MIGHLLHDHSVRLVMPEAFLAVTGMAALIYGVVRGDRSTRSVFAFVLAAFAIAAILCLQNSSNRAFDVFNGMAIVDVFGTFVKPILLAASGFALLLSLPYLHATKNLRPEYPVLVLFATLGMMLMVSAHDFMALYVGLELQNLSLYVLAAFRRDDPRSSEAGLKYFVLGALSSGLMLYGISLLYGYGGTTNFALLAERLASATPPLGATVGLVFLAAGFAFKIAAVPFHMWAPDVYEGAPTSVTAFFAAAPKLAAFALLTRLFAQPLASMATQWQPLIILIAVASMLWGSFGGLRQSNLKRLMAYSSIANAGYILVGLAILGQQGEAREAGVQALLISITLYIVTTLGAFGVILSLRRGGRMVEKIEDLASLSKTHRSLSLVMLFFMFSLAGVPPLAGFFGKYILFLAAIKAGLLPLALLGVLTSVVAAYYYLRIVKVMFFDESTEAAIDPVPEFALRIPTAFAAFLLVLFVGYPEPLLNAAKRAAYGLF